MPRGAYPPNTFPDVASALVDAERRAQFEEAGAHYEFSYFLTLVYLPPGGGGRHCGAVALRKQQPNRRCRRARDAERICRSHQPRPAAHRRLHAGMRLAR